MHTQKFGLNGKTYTSDIETLCVLRSISPDAHSTGDSSAVAAIVTLGLTSGKITEMES